MISHRRQKADKDTKLGHVILSIQICVLVTIINLWSLFWIILSALVSLDQFLFTFCEKCHAFRKSGKKIKSNYSSLHSPFKLEKSIKSKKQDRTYILAYWDELRWKFIILWILSQMHTPRVSCVWQDPTNEGWVLREWWPIIIPEPPPSLLGAGYTLSCDFESLNFWFLVFLSPVFSWASILMLRHSFEIILVQILNAMSFPGAYKSTISLLLIVMECSGV